MAYGTCDRCDKYAPNEVADDVDLCGSFCDACHEEVLTLKEYDEAYFSDDPIFPEGSLQDRYPDRFDSRGRIRSDY